MKANSQKQRCLALRSWILLFLIYVNDFCRCITKGKTIMFADDTNLFFSKSCYEKVFQVANEELKRIDNWLTANKLSFNVKLIILCCALRIVSFLVNMLSS